ncbi:hypothetical protein [Magnetovibrio sp.]
MPNSTATESKVSDTSVSTNWPDELPVVDAEMDLFEEHLLDILTAMFQHG